MKRFLLGVGNRLSRDDGVGPFVAQAMDGATGWTAIDCGTSLENISGIITREKPDLLVLVDAAQMDVSPGEVRLLPSTGTDRMLVSTHGLPLPFVLDRLRQHVGRIELIGIQISDVSLGEGLSPDVLVGAKRLVSALCDGTWTEIQRIGTQRPR